MAGLRLTTSGVIGHTTASCARRAAALCILVLTTYPQGQSSELLLQFGHCTSDSATLKIVLVADMHGDVNQVLASLLPIQRTLFPCEVVDRSDFQNSDGRLWNSGKRRRGHK